MVNMNRLAQRIHRFREDVGTRKSAYLAEYLIFEMLATPGGSEQFRLRCVHDSTTGTALATMRRCATYLVVSSYSRVATVETTFGIVQGDSAKESLDAAESLMQVVLDECRTGEPKPSLACRDSRMSDTMQCRFGILPRRHARVEGSGPPIHRWEVNSKRPTEGRELFGHGLAHELRRRYQPWKTHLHLTERDMKKSLPVTLKHVWRPVDSEVRGTRLSHADGLVSLLRRVTTIPEDLWSTLVLPDDLDDTYRAYDEQHKRSYVPAPTDLALHDFILVDSLYHQFVGAPHIDVTSGADEDRRLVHLPAFLWSGEDCETSTILNARPKA